VQLPQELSEDIRATWAAVKDLDKQGQQSIDCGESGTTLRILLPILAALGKETAFGGAGRLPERPLDELLQLLERHGIHCVYAEPPRTLPLLITGQLRNGRYALPGNVSSQYISGLLFALPLLRHTSQIVLTSPAESAGYIRMTQRTLSRFGIKIRETAYGYSIPGGQQYTSSESTFRAEGDWSNAAFPLCAGALAGEMTVSGLDSDSLQPDKRILSLLEEMGASVSVTGDAVTVRRGELRGASLDASGCPDLVPIAAVLMSLAQGRSRIYNAARLRLKESDRIAAVVGLITALGGKAQALPDGIEIEGQSALRGGGTVDSQNDHRIAMSAAVAALRCEKPVTLTGAEAVSKSWPGFFTAYAAWKIS
jgi:3-phosphoshikimate 1-carboxyvinyltransferase